MCNFLLAFVRKDIFFFFFFAGDLKLGMLKNSSLCRYCAPNKKACQSASNPEPEPIGCANKDLRLFYYSSGDFRSIGICPLDGQIPRLY